MVCMEQLAYLESEYVESCRPSLALCELAVAERELVQRLRPVIDLCPWLPLDYSVLDARAAR